MAVSVFKKLAVVVAVLSAVSLSGLTSCGDDVGGGWEKRETRDKWGEVSGHHYAQTVRSKGKGADGFEDTWKFTVAHYSKDNVEIIIEAEGSEYDDVPTAGMWRDRVKVSLRSEDGNTQDFTCRVSEKRSSDSRLSVICKNMGLVEALAKNTKYKIRLDSKDWHVMADIVGGLPAGEASKSSDGESPDADESEAPASDANPTPASSSKPSAGAQSATNRDSRLVGTWSDPTSGASFQRERIFRIDGSFEDVEHGGGKTSREKGTWRTANNRTLTTTSREDTTTEPYRISVSGGRKQLYIGGDEEGFPSYEQ